MTSDAFEPWARRQIEKLWSRVLSYDSALGMVGKVGKTDKEEKRVFNFADLLGKVNVGKVNVGPNICPVCGPGVFENDECCAACGATLITPEVQRHLRQAALREALQWSPPQLINGAHGTNRDRRSYAHGFNESTSMYLRNIQELMQI